MAQIASVLHCRYINKKKENAIFIHMRSRHIVVCHAAQEASTPHREYKEEQKHNFHTCVTSCRLYEIGRFLLWRCPSS